MWQWNRLPRIHLLISYKSFINYLSKTLFHYYKVQIHFIKITICFRSVNIWRNKCQLWKGKSLMRSKTCCLNMISLLKRFSNMRIKTKMDSFHMKNSQAQSTMNFKKKFIGDQFSILKVSWNCDTHIRFKIILIIDVYYHFTFVKFVNFHFRLFII